DSIDVAREAASLFSNDSRVAQFFDPGQISGLEVAGGLNAEPGEVAWDIYLFFDGQDKWLDRMPQPKDWVHQLKGSRWAEPVRFYQGDQLAPSMLSKMENLL
ncbi:MAG: hypothetical protein WBF36_13995, partial [Desulfobulbales bacterium]